MNKASPIRSDAAPLTERADTCHQLPRMATTPEYPIAALGAILGPAAAKIAAQVRVSPVMAAQSVLAAASLAVQGLVDVHIDGRVIPASLYIITIAGSGERKTSTDKLAMMPILEYQSELRGQHRAVMANFKDEMRSYQTRNKADLIQNNDTGTGLDQRNQIHPPERPQVPWLIVQEPTLEGLFNTYVIGRPSLGLFTSEGGQFFGGHGMNDDAMLRTISTLSKLWDLDPISRVRASAEDSGWLEDRRLCAHLMLQPVLARKVLANELMTGQGFLARFLIAQPQAMAGSRFLLDDESRPLMPRVSLEQDPDVVCYWQKLRELISRPLPINPSSEGLQPSQVFLTDDAWIAWAAAHDEIERQMGPNGELAEHKPTASKAADNLLRIAAILSFVEGQDSITSEYIERASTLMTFYLNTQLQLFDTYSQNRDEQDALHLLKWMQEKDSKQFDAKDMGKNAPRGTGARGSVKRLRLLMALLETLGHIEPVRTDTKGNASTWEVLSYD